MEATNDTHTATTDRLEETVLVALLAVVGMLGIAIGIFAAERTVEPAVGLLILLALLGTFVKERRRRHQVTPP